MAKNHDLDMPGLLVEPVDEFAMQADYSDVRHGRSLLGFDAFQRAGVINTQVFPVRTQRNGAFQGVYNYLDLYDGTWREREGYDDNQFFKANINAFDSTVPLANRRFEKKNPDDTDYAPLQAFLNGVTLTGTAEHDYMAANADLPQLINYAAVTAIIQHVDSTTKNFYLAQDPATNRWSMLPWDLDHTFGNKCCFINSTFVTPSEPGDRINPIMEALLATPQWREMYFRRLRTLVNDLLATGRMEALYDAKVGIAQPEIALDFARWVYDETESYTTQRSRLVKGINGPAHRVRQRCLGSPATSLRRPTSSSTRSSTPPRAVTPPSSSSSTTPAPPPSTSPAGAHRRCDPGLVDPARHRHPAPLHDDLRRPTTRPSGPPTAPPCSSGTATPAPSRPPGHSPSPDPTPPSPTALTYGGAGWPVPTAGQSLELTNLAADNNDGANWALSTGSGTPGTTTGGPAVTAPSAPTIGTASAGNASATARWTAPTDDGGSGITGYSVKVLDNAGTQVGALRPAGATATTLTVTGLTNGTTYRFQVAATNSAGTGAYSALSDGVTPTAGTVIAARGAHDRHRHRRQHHRHRRWTHPPTTAAPPSPATRSASSTPPAPRSAPCDPPARGTASPSPDSPTAPPTGSRSPPPTPPAPAPTPPPSNAVTPRRHHRPPGAPIIGTPSQGAAGGSLTAIARWTPPTSTGGSAITGYQVTALRMSSSAADATVLWRPPPHRILGAIVTPTLLHPRRRQLPLPVVAINAIGTGPASARSANIVPR